MKTKRLLAILGLGLAVLICVTIICGISSQKAMGTIATGQPVFGYTELALSGNTNGSSGALNLSGGAAAAGTSIPCYNLTLIPTMTYTGSGTASLYVGSGTANCTCLLMSGGSNHYAGKTGSLLVTGSGAVTYVQSGTPQNSVSLPMVTNVNQLWFKLTNSDSGASTATCSVEALYTK